ncbi:MAG: IS3 family transposase, partial [Marichromatium sp.]|nr:IS3 family transposase [Marichromatium sp.]
MRKRKYSEQQIVNALRRAESGVPVKDVCRELGVSAATFYQWRSKYGGMEASDLKRLRALEEENRRLKHMYADLSLDHKILKEIVGKKALSARARRALAGESMAEGVSKRRVCRLLGLSRSVLDYHARPRDDGPLIKALSALAERHPSAGFRKLYVRLRRAGHPWNHKRVWRVYCALKLNLRRRRKRLRALRPPQPLVQPIRPNLQWSADFMSDALSSGMSYRTFNLIDDFNREALRIEVDVSLTSARVIRVLEQVISVRGRPERLRLDNGPEFTSTAFQRWAAERGIALDFISPGKPTQNGFIERFNGSFRRELLDAWLFNTLEEVRQQADDWLDEYNLRRPHESLGDLSPIEFLNRR